MQLLLHEQSKENFCYENSILVMKPVCYKCFITYGNMIRLLIHKDNGRDFGKFYSGTGFFFRNVKQDCKPGNSLFKFVIIPVPVFVARCFFSHVF